MNDCSHLGEVESSEDDKFQKNQPKIAETAHKATLNLLPIYLGKITNVFNMNCFGQSLTKTV